MSRRRDLPVSLDLLRGFEAAARLLSFTGAAAELFLTQSAVSRQVQQLEEQLGVKLFERRTRALELTDAGERYFHEVSKALNHLREATAMVRARTEPVVRVTTTVTFASLWLVPRLTAFQESHAGISVHCVADNALRELERASLDVAVRYTTQAMAGPDAVRLFGEHVSPVASPAFLKKHAVHTVDDLMRLPLLERDDPGPGAWLSWKAWFKAMQLTPPRRSGLSFSHYDQIVQAAMAGQGVALGRFPLIDDFLREGRLVRVLPSPQFALAIDRAYWLVVAPAAAARAEVGEFCAWLRDEAVRAGTRKTSRARKAR